MKEEERVRTNLDFLNEFMKCAFDSPEILDQIPSGAEVVILPLDDSEMMQANREMVECSANRGRPVVLVKFRKPEVVSLKLELLRG